MGAATFLGITDTPSSFSGQAGKIPKVNAGETALEFLMGSFGVLSGDKDGVPSFGSLSVAAGSSSVASAETARKTNSSSYVKLKEIVCPVSGTYTVSFFLGSTSGTATAFGRIYKNGSAFGTERSTTSASFPTYGNNYDENLTFTKGDLIQIYSKISNASYEAGVKNFYLKCAVTFTPPVPVGVVNTD